MRGSVELLDVREYVPGDEVRHLHWKATARGESDTIFTPDNSRYQGELVLVLDRNQAPTKRSA